MGKKAIKKGGKLGQVAEKKVLPIETDPMKLVNFVCGSNINVKGEDVKVGEFQMKIQKVNKNFSFRLNQTANILSGYGPYTLDRQRSSTSLTLKPKPIGGNSDRSVVVGIISS